MAPAPKPTIPIYNKEKIQAPPFTTVLKVADTTGQSETYTIATGTSTKQSWRGVFQVPDAPGIGPSRNLDSSVANMANDSYLLQAYLKNSSAGCDDNSSKGTISQEQVLLIIAKHRVTWDQEISVKGTKSGRSEDSHEIVMAGAIYSMFRMIPRHKDTIA